MKLRLPSIGCLIGAIAIATIGLTSVPAAADAPRDQGWWTVTNPLPPLPDVPARGLLVQGGGGGAPTAVAAILYELEQDRGDGGRRTAPTPLNQQSPGGNIGQWGKRVGHGPPALVARCVGACRCGRQADRHHGNRPRQQQPPH